LFVYPHPQNLHAGSLHEKKHKIEIRPHPGFDAQYASELQRVDRSFGEFITFLKSHNIYDNSLVVLTADHGDSFNDYGRFGHGNLFPEVLRIPLIVHLPDYYRRTLSWDEKEVAFSLDLTPSLYELLGHPVIRNPLFGRPLFTRSTEERKSYLRNYYPVVSSYLPIYGILENNGQGLYISDALNRSNFYLNLASDPLAKRNRITPEIQKQNEQRIRTFLEQLSKFNHYTPPAS
jgi:arylsulfatase A-like enzyme